MLRIIFKLVVLNFLNLFIVLIFSQNLIAQNKVQTNDQQYKDFYSLLFFDSENQNIPQGTIILPGRFPEFNYDLNTNLISFEKEFLLEYPNANTQLVFDGGFHDEGMVLINGQFIDSKIINSQNGYSHTIPSGILKKGINSITILAIFHSPLWNFEGDIFIENGLEKIILNGYWDYTSHQNLERNFQRKPTQGLDLFGLLDLDLTPYTQDSNIKRTWSRTNLPITLETLYNDKNLNGAFCFKKTITFDKPPEEDYYFTIEKGIDDYDRLYVNGYLVGTTDCFSCERRYKIPHKYLKQYNEFTLFVVDKNGPGGILSPIFLKNKTTEIDISNQWSYKKLLELQMLITLKNTESDKSLFGGSNFNFYDLGGNKLDVNELLAANKTSLSISSLLFFLFIGLMGVAVTLYLVNVKKTDNQKAEAQDATSKNQKFIFIRADRADHKILIHDIESIEGKKDYVKLQLESNSYLVRKNLKTFLSQLPSSKFIRISKSVAINLDKISKIEKNIVFLNKGSYHVISKTYIKDISELFAK